MLTGRVGWLVAGSRVFNRALHGRSVVVLLTALVGLVLVPAHVIASSTGSITGRVTAGGFTSLPGIEACTLTMGGESAGCSQTADGEGFEAGRYTISGLPAGAYKVRFRDPKGEYLTQYYKAKQSWEEADLVQVSAEALTWDVDAGLDRDFPPTTTLTRMPQDTVVISGRSATVVYEFEISEPASSECRLDSGPFRSCDSPHSVKASLGSHRFSVRSTDAAGHMGYAVSDTFQMFHREPPRGKSRSCANFFSQVEAQRYFVKHRRAAVRGGFDPDNDGVACEERPGPFLGAITIAFSPKGNFFYGHGSLPAKGREVHCWRERPWVILRKAKPGEDSKVSELPVGEVKDRKGNAIPGRFEWKSKARQASGSFYASVLFYEGPKRQCFALKSAPVNVTRR